MKNLFPFILAMLFVACENSPSETSEKSDTSNDAPGFEVTFVEYSDRDADCTKEECTEVKITLPQLKGGDSLVATEINQQIEDRYRQLIKSRLPEPQSTGSWESLAASFIDGYELFKMEFPDDPTAWYLYMDGSESSVVGDSIFTAVLDESDFMGGAHGNTAKLVESYRLEDGMRIDFVERYGPQLKKLAEEKFRAHHGIPANEPLNDAGFIFPEVGFILPENIGYSDKGLMLIYNPYEVASYSTGATVLTIPISELEAPKEAI